MLCIMWHLGRCSAPWTQPTNLHWCFVVVVCCFCGVFVCLFFLDYTAGIRCIYFNLVCCLRMTRGALWHRDLANTRPVLNKRATFFIGCVFFDPLIHKQLEILRPHRSPTFNIVPYINISWIICHDKHIVFIFTFQENTDISSSHRWISLGWWFLCTKQGCRVYFFMN